MDRHIVEHYDSYLFTVTAEEYTGRSGFANFGFWDEATTDAGQASRRLMGRLLEFLPEKRGIILDVACGKGGTTSYLLNYYPPTSVTAINMSEKQLRVARENVAGYSFVVADAVSGPFWDWSFDNVICVEAAFHFCTRERFFREALRVLKPGGRLILSDVLMAEGAERRRLSFHEENYLPGVNAYVDLARRAGFREVEITDATEPCWYGHFWGLVDFAYRKLLAGELNVAQVKALLDLVYKLVGDVKCYLLAALRRSP